MQPATQAMYTNIFFLHDGVVITFNNEGPDYTTEQDNSDWQDTWPLPQLRQWGDIVGLTYA